MKHLWTCMLLIFLIVQNTNAQEYYDFEYDFPTHPDSLVNLSMPKVSQFLEIGISSNAYRGDLAGYEKFTQVFHLALKLNKKRLLNSRFGLSTGFITGENRLYAFTDESGGRTSPNTFFRTSIFSLDYELQVNVYRTRNFALYLSQGLGFIRFNVKNDLRENLIDFQETRAANETYNNFAFMLPTGLGATYFLKNGFGLGAQASILNTQSDYLDNISEWGIRSGNDNVLRFKFYLYIPFKKQPVRDFAPPIKDVRKTTHY